MRTRSFRTALAVTALLAATTVGATAGTAQAKGKPAKPCTPSWQLVSTPDSTAGMSAISVLSQDNVWFTGFDSFGGGSSEVFHRNGDTVGRGTQIPEIPLGNGQIVVTSSFDSDSNGWAQMLASSGNDTHLSVAEHWSGKRWIMTPLALSPDPRNIKVNTDGIVSLSPNDAWIAGHYSPPLDSRHEIGAMLQHWDGSSWSIVPNPADQQDGGTLRAFAVLSPTDIWAVGRQWDVDGIALPLTMHWDGTSWTRVEAPRGNGSTGLFAVSASGPDDIWAVGNQTIAGSGNEATPVVLHWDGTQWSIVPGLPDLGNAGLTSVYASGPNDVWATVTGPDTFLHWDGTSWSTVPTPGLKALNLVYSYSAVGGTGPNDVWASGVVHDNSQGLSTSSTGTAQVAHLTCGKG